MPNTIPSLSDAETLDARTKAKRKKMAVEAKPKTRAKMADAGQASSSAQQTITDAQTPESSDMQKIFAELLALRKDAELKHAETQRWKEEAQNTWAQYGEEDATYVGQPQDGGARADTWQYDVEEDDDEEYEDEDSDSQSMAEQLIILRNKYSARPTMKLGDEKTPETRSAPAAPFSSFRMPPPPKPMAEETAETKQADGSSAKVKQPKRRDFILDTDLQEGALLSEIQLLYQERRKPVVNRVTISENMAGVINHYYLGPEKGGPKPLKCIREFARKYTGLADVPEARVQLMNDEIRFGDGRKEGESALMTASKGVVAALTAIAPLMDVVMQRGSADPELNNHALDMLNAIKVLVCTHSQLRVDRTGSVTKVVNSRLGKELIKQKRDVYGDLPLPSEYLLGDNLGERNKQLMKSVRASDNCMQTNLAHRGKRRAQTDQQNRGSNSYTRYRGNGRFRGNRGRGTSNWGAKQQPPEKKFGRTSEDYAQHGNTPTHNRGRGQGSSNRGGFHK